MTFNKPDIGKTVKLLMFLVFVVSLNSCKSSKSPASKSTNKSIPKTTTSRPVLNETASAIIKYAEQFKGVTYKYGGTTKKGWIVRACSTLPFNRKALTSREGRKILQKRAIG